MAKIRSPSFLYHAVGGIKDPVVERNAAVKIEKYGADPIVIPIVLKMADFDHKVREFFIREKEENSIALHFGLLKLIKLVFAGTLHFIINGLMLTTCFDLFDLCRHCWRSGYLLVQVVRNSRSRF